MKLTYTTKLGSPESTSVEMEIPLPLQDRTTHTFRRGPELLTIERVLTMETPAECIADRRDRLEAIYARRISSLHQNPGLLLEAPAETLEAHILEEDAAQVICMLASTLESRGEDLLLITGIFPEGAADWFTPMLASLRLRPGASREGLPEGERWVERQVGSLWVDLPATFEAAGAFRFEDGSQMLLTVTFEPMAPPAAAGAGGEPESPAEMEPGPAVGRGGVKMVTPKHFGSRVGNETISEDRVSGPMGEAERYIVCELEVPLAGKVTLHLRGRAQSSSAAAFHGLWVLVRQSLTFSGEPRGESIV